MVNDTADAIVAESAAAATQIATGLKVPALTVSMAADGRTPLKTILEIAKEKGMATGLVTTSGITDATPAAFAAHVVHRSDELSVAVQKNQLGVDVLLGGRKQFFLPEAVGVAMEFRRTNPDTLLIVTTDHETGGMAIVGHWKGSRDYVGIDFSAIQKAQASFERILDELGKNPTAGRIRDTVKKHLGIEVTLKEARIVANAGIHKQDPRSSRRATPHPLAFVLQPHLGVAWASQTHTASPLFAFRSVPGSEELVGFRHNTELFRIMQGALAVAQ
jgi:alkaline phosphatase